MKSEFSKVLQKDAWGLGQHFISSNSVRHKIQNMLYFKQPRWKWGQCAQNTMFGSSKRDEVPAEVITCVKNANKPFHDTGDGTLLSVILKCACVINEFDIMISRYFLVSSIIVKVDMYVFMLTNMHLTKWSSWKSFLPGITLYLSAYKAAMWLLVFQDYPWEVGSCRSWLLSLFTYHSTSDETSVPLSSKHVVQTNTFSRPL